MQLLPLQTKLIRPGDDVVLVLSEATTGRRVEGSALLKATEENQESRIKNQDILVVSSKAVATAEGRIVDLKKWKVTKEAETLSRRCGRSPAFCQAVLNEMQVRNGEVRGTCKGAILTELRPFDFAQGDKMGTIFAPNAGLDESNIEKGFAIGWPEDPVASVKRLREGFTRFLVSSNQRANEQTRKRETAQIAVVLSDSCCVPRRKGITAFALAVSGIDPLRDEAGKNDLSGKPLRITVEAVADQLATAANFLMGNANQSVPAVIIRDHGLSLSDFEGWIPGIEPEKDLFAAILCGKSHCSS